jgi:hypothetical protein
MISSCPGTTSGASLDLREGRIFRNTFDPQQGSEGERFKTMKKELMENEDDTADR